MNSTLWKIIPPHFRRRALFVTATIFLRAILNFVGVAMLIPILMLILDSSTLHHFNICIFFVFKGISVYCCNSRLIRIIV